MTTHLFTQEGHLSDLTLDRLLLEDLSGDEHASVQEHLEACAACREDLDAVRHHDAAFFETHAPDWAAPAQASGRAPRAEGGEASRTFWSATTRRALLTLGAAAIAVFALMPLLQAPSGGRNTGPEEGIRIKGEPMRMEVYVHDGKTARVAMHGERVSPGDRLGFKLFTRQSGWIMIVGWDHTKELYIGYPQTRGEPHAESMEARPEGVDLQAALVLDDLLGVEHLMAIQCQEPFAFEAVRQDLSRALAQGGDRKSALGSGCTQHELMLHKHPTPGNTP